MNSMYKRAQVCDDSYGIIIENGGCHTVTVYGAEPAHMLTNVSFFPSYNDINVCPYPISPTLMAYLPFPVPLKVVRLLFLIKPPIPGSCSELIGRDP